MLTGKVKLADGTWVSTVLQEVEPVSGDVADVGGREGGTGRRKLCGKRG